MSSEPIFQKSLLCHVFRAVAMREIAGKEVLREDRERKLENTLRVFD